MPGRLRAPPRGRGRTGDAHAPDVAPGPGRPGVRRSGRALPPAGARVPHAGRLRARGAGGRRPERPGLPQAGLAAAHRGVLRRLADANGPGQAAATRSPTCCCSTSPPITSIWRPATGWSSTCRRTLTPSSWSRTTATFWMSPYTRSSRSGTGGSTSFPGTTRAMSN